MLELPDGGRIGDAVAAWEQRAGGVCAELAQPHAQDLPGHAGERGAPFLSAFAFAPDPASGKVEVLAAQAGELGGSEPALADLQPKQTFIAGRPKPASKRTQRRLRRYRTGAEGRISHLKRRYGPDRSRLKGDQIWTERGILAYNVDTLAVRTR